MTVGQWTRCFRAPRRRVYQALLDADAVQQWMVPDGMTSEVHSFDASEGGATRLVATHEDVPAGVAPADNDAGWNMSLDKLAALVEAAGPPDS